MTQNQIRYWESVETQRSNRAREKENTRHNTVSEKETSRHNLATENESARHNLRTEGQTDASIAESTRHNKATESNESNKVRLGYANLSESRRHNMAGENLQSSSISENRRHNMVSESISSLLGGETVRHNQETERQGAQRNQIEGVKAAISGVKAAGDLANSILGGKSYGKQKQNEKSSGNKQTYQQIQTISGRNILLQR